MTGKASSSPRTVVERERVETSRRNPLAKLDAVKVVTVRGERRFTEGAPVDVVEELSGKFAARQLAVVINRGRGEIEAVVTFVLGHNSLCSTRREFSPEPLTLPGDRAMLLQCSRRE